VYKEERRISMMRFAALCGLLSTMAFPIQIAAQVLGGDPNFPLLNEIRWDMKTVEIENLCESRKSPLRTSDSTLTFQARFFETSTRVKVQFDRASQLPQMVEIVFQEATAAIHDTLVNHFARKIGKPPLVTTKEKSAIIFTIKMEVASWRGKDEIISVMTMMQGSEILGVNLLISKATVAAKP
jgi:hypothetical protein